MAEALEAFAVDVDVVVAPQGLEFGTEPAQLFDKLADFRDGTGARCIRPERADHKAGHALPIILRRPHAGVPEDQAKDVALAGRQRAVVCQHGGGRVYASALPIADRIIMTEVELSPPADVFFPKPDPTDWQETSRVASTSVNGTRFSIITYARRLPAVTPLQH